MVILFLVHIDIFGWVCIGPFLEELLWMPLYKNYTSINLQDISGPLATANKINESVASKYILHMKLKVVVMIHLVSVIR
jgi:hypothetical protein